MIPGATDRVPLLDWWVARWEVSRLAVVPIALSLFSLWAGFVGLAIIGRVSGAKPVLAGRIFVAVWVIVLGLEIGRGIWTMRHRYASPRWLRGVSAAVGDEVVVHALAALIRRYDQDPDHVVTRSDMMHAIQVERARRRDAGRRAEGFRLVEEVVPAANALAVAKDERRRRSRERRAARRAEEPA